VEHYSLQAIIAVGFKIENERAVQFRKWANRIVKDYPILGWVMDVERLRSTGAACHSPTSQSLSDFLQNGVTPHAAAATTAPG